MKSIGSKRTHSCDKLFRRALHGLLLWLIWIIGLVASAPTAFAQTTPPVTGTAVPVYEPLDRVVLDFMKRCDCPAATAAVSYNGKVAYSRGYGFCDAHGKKPTPPDALLRIAGLTEPITAAAVKTLIGEGKLSRETQAFQLLNLKPLRGSVDSRIKEITVSELLDNQAGWDPAVFDPFVRLRDVEKALHISRKPRPVEVVRYMLTQPLQYSPGERKVPANFGYCVLGRVIEKASGKSYGTYLADEIFKPLGVEDVKLAHNPPREPREVWYPVKDVPVESMDSFAGLVASAPALCRFLDAFWVNGDARQPGDDLQWTYYGSLAGSTGLVRQRPDGFNIAILCTVRGKTPLSEKDSRDLEKLVDQAIDKVSVKQ
jgi:CubicO group peptidase (beta-lactamase class C family)